MRTERLRWLSIALFCVIVVVAVVVTLFCFFMATQFPDKSLPAKLLAGAAGLAGGAGFGCCYWLARWFRRREERIFLPAVCKAFDGVQVEVAPKGATIAALQPYWDFDLIAASSTSGRSVKIDVEELFTGERHGIALSLVAVRVWETVGRSVNELFRGDLVELTLPGPEYPTWRFNQDDLQDIDAASRPHGLATPGVVAALTGVGNAFFIPQIAGAISGIRFYLAVPASRQGRRVAAIGLWRPIYRVEPAIRAALAQLAAVLRLVDAVADACGQPAAQSLWAGDAAGVPAPAAALPPAARAPAIVGSALRPLRLALRVLGVLVVGTAVIVGIFLLYIQHYNAQALAQIRQAAEEGDAAAQNIIGNLHWSGGGVPQGTEEALRWYRMAADQG